MNTGTDSAVKSNESGDGIKMATTATLQTTATTATVQTATLPKAGKYFYKVLVQGKYGTKGERLVCADSMDEVEGIIAAKGAAHKDADGNPFPLEWDILLIAKAW